MKRLEAISEVEEGSRLKIVGKCEKDNYDDVTVKRIIHCENSKRVWDEILLCKKNNYFFNVDMYLRGASWAQDVYILENKEKTDGQERS